MIDFDFLRRGKQRAPINRKHDEKRSEKLRASVHGPRVVPGLDEEEEVRWTPHQSPVAIWQQHSRLCMTRDQWRPWPPPPTRSHARPAGELQAWRLPGRPEPDGGHTITTSIGPPHGRLRRLLPSSFSTIYCSHIDGEDGGRRWLAPWEAVNYSYSTTSSCSCWNRNSWASAAHRIN